MITTTIRSPRCLGLWLGLLIAAATLLSVPPALAVTAAPAWAPVAVSGPTNLPPAASEVQRVGVDAEGGSFTLTQTTTGAGTLSFGSGFGTLTSGSDQVGFFVLSGAFTVGETISGTGIPAGATITAVAGSTLTMSANAESSGFFVSVTGVSNEVTGVSVSSGAFHAGDEITGTGVPAGTTIATVGAGTLTLSASPTAGGAQTLTTTETTAPIPYDAPPSGPGGVQESLEALPALGVGSVSVSGGPGGPGATDPYSLTFNGGSVAYTDVAQMISNASSLTGSGQSATVTTTVPGGLGSGQIAIYAQNVGGATSAGEITIEDHLPVGILTSGTPTGGEGGSLSCTAGVGHSSITCKTAEAVGPSRTLPSIVVPVVIGPAAAGTEVNVVSVSGGGAANTATYEGPVAVSATPAKPGFQAFSAGAYGADGIKTTQAGSHPYLATSAIFANTFTNAKGEVVPVGDPRTIDVDLPAGFLGNPVAAPTCPEGVKDVNCPLPSQVGLAQPVIAVFGETGNPVPIHNVLAPFGYPGKFTFEVSNLFKINALGILRSDEDYGISVTSFNTPQVLDAVYGVFFTFWGAPEDPSHNAQRCKFIKPASGCGAGSPENKAFLTMPTDCALEAEQLPFARLKLDTWQSTGEFSEATVPLPVTTGCDQLNFEGKFNFQPVEAAKANTPTPFSTEITVPPEGLTDPSKLTTPELKRVVARLPEGLALDPSAADGLAACSEAQIGLEGTNYGLPNPMHFNESPNECPESSKIGSVELTTALLEEPLQGELYLAAQGEGNPFGSLFAVYLVVENPRHGVFIKLAGRVEADKQTGQLQVSFEDLPQLPFTSVKLQIKGGSRAPLTTGATCGTYTTSTELTPWSAPESGAPFQAEDSFNVGAGPNGTPCVSTAAQRPFAPGLRAGTSNTAAGGFSPFTLELTRQDNEQELSSISVNAPSGFTAVLTGVPYCPQAAIEAAEHNSGRAELANASCPVASQIGTLAVGTGPGPNPFHVSGKAYLAGPYKDAPFSIVFVTPAVAGPFDLGDVVVRAGIYIDRTTAQVTVKSDPLPQILDGVPLQVRSITAEVDRPDFALNPTSCEKFSVATTVNGASGAVASSSVPFQVGGCAGLKFSPKFAVSTSGKTSRANGASLAVKLTYPTGNGEANIARVKVELPKQLPSRLTTLQKACTAAVFNANPAGCPAESIIGRAKATTPVLPVPLVGPAYFVSHGGEAFPSLIVVLQGDGVTVDLVGATFISKQGITSSTFKTVPDVPVGSFELTLPEGKYSALAANGNLCASVKTVVVKKKITRKVKGHKKTVTRNVKQNEPETLKMPTEFVGQNGTVIHQATPISVTDCAKAAHPKKKAHKKKGRKKK